jgi:pyruvate,water dikinase
MSEHVLHFADPACQDNRQVGGKALGLAEMTTQGLPVAPGFAVTASAYRDFLSHSRLRETLDEILQGAHADEVGSLASAGEHAEQAVLAAPLPEPTAAAITEAYQQLCDMVGVPDVAVAVRSSATAEDSVGASFAGEFETWVDVRGIDSVLDHVRKCYAAVYSARVLDYLEHQKIDPQEIEMAVVVQKTVRARSAGVMFTISPISGDRSRVVIEASFGLGLAVVGGEVTPDRYVVDKVTLDVSEEVLGDKRIEYRRGDLPPTDVDPERQGKPCLQAHEVQTLVRYGKQLERLHGSPQDIEFAIDEELPEDANIILLQCRPETVWSQVKRKPAFESGAGVMSWITGTLTGTSAAEHKTPTDVHDHD